MSTASEGVHCIAPWDVPKRVHHRTGEYSRSPQEWMPRPLNGRSMGRNGLRRDGSPLDSKQKAPQKSPDYNPPMNNVIYLQIVPGPQRLWQVVRVELQAPVARGFKTKEGARKWIERAVRAGVLPQGVTEIEAAGAADAK